MIQEEFSRKISVRKIPADGLSLTLTATPEERLSLAARLGILSCEDLTAEIVLTAHDGGRKVRGRGRLCARVTQACVVTLLPVAQDIEEPLSLLFLEEDDDAPESAVIDLDPSDDAEVPDPIVKGTIDVGAPVSEHLALALDPYPRSPGAVFQPPEDEPEAPVATANPFVALRALRGGRDDDANGNET